jgi:hypothetical protein
MTCIVDDETQVVKVFETFSRVVLGLSLDDIDVSISVHKMEEVE